MTPKCRDLIVGRDTAILLRRTRLRDGIISHTEHQAF
jgi:hypothetical protein